jgi:copper(I)-binding protein
VQIHWDDNCGDVFQPVPTLPLPPAEPAVIDLPTGAIPFDAYHLRLVGLTQEVLAGVSVPLTSHFQHAGTVSLEAHVQPSNAPRAEPSTRCDSDSAT